MREIKIEVRQLTRVEGHGNIVVKAGDGKVETVRWEVTEAPRFFEMMFRTRPWHDVHVLASRICGICSVSHQLASIAATEAAFGLKPSEQTVRLRKLLYAGEVIESHMLHLYLLALPDFSGVGSIFPLINKENVLRGLRLKRLGNEIMERIGGRAVHPQAAIVNGFGRLPREPDLLYLRDRLKASQPDLDATVELFKSFDLPDFSRETEYIALKHPDEYAFIRGSIFSSDSGLSDPADYQGIIKEYSVPQSTAKFARHDRDSYAVGSLARVNCNYEQLRPLAKQAAAELGLKPPCYNPFMNTMAQIAETIHEVEEGLEITEELLNSGVREEANTFKIKAGRGVGAVEAPRGLLIHDYTYDESGSIIRANCIIPTNQNHANIQRDLEAMVNRNLDLDQDKLRHLCEILVRSYDPCISCSTH
jgi:coenzyme F420-reducing hydrogenase alpha subunit